MATQLLVVEDCRPLNTLLCQHLAQYGFLVDAAYTGTQAMQLLTTQHYDIFILDLGLPDIDGLQLLLQQSAPPPCIILTARDALTERIQGLNTGADDYLIKPIDIAELEARIRAVLRRHTPAAITTLQCGNLRLEPKHFHVTIGEIPLSLTRLETLLLEELLHTAPRICIKNQLEERLYDAVNSVTPNAIEALVSRLRRKLSEAGATLTIETIRGIGYRILDSTFHE